MADSKNRSNLLESELFRLAEPLLISAIENSKKNIKLLKEDPNAFAEDLAKNLKTQLQDPTNFIGGGAAGTIRGVLAKNWNAKAATKAVDMMIAKENPGNIWRETGTYHNPVDKKLRQEISDAPAKLTKSIGELSKMPMTKLSEILDHPELFEAYPKLKKLDVALIPGERGGTFYKETRFQDPLLEVGLNQDVRSVLLHEIQHSIQRTEGFASGANYEAAQKFIETKSPKLQAAEKLRETKKDSMTPEALALLDKQIKQFQDLLGEKTPMDVYKRSAGETEARTVQARRDMTDEERRLMAPFVEQDVPWHLQIADILK